MNEQPATAAIVIIGNEILSAKVKDTNSFYLCEELRFLGVDVQRIITIPDDFETIGKIAKEYSGKYTWVFTSGGIGPTHDDITVSAIAAGLGVETVQSPELGHLIKKYYGDELTEAHLKMAEIPAGSNLIKNKALLSPQLQFRNIFIFPGIPELLQSRFNAIKEMFKQVPIFLKQIFMTADEGAIAEILNATMERYPELLLGSYPALWRKDYTLKLTLESRAESYLNKALDYLKEHLPKDKILRID